MAVPGIASVVLVGVATVALAGCTATGSGTVRTSTSAPRADASSTGALAPDAVREILEKQAGARARLLMPTDVPVFCAIAPMGGSDDGRWTYVTALCETFSDTDGVVAMGSGTSVPVRVDNEHFTVEVPGDGNVYGPDVRRLFPADLADQILSGGAKDFDQTEAQLRERAVRVLAS